MVVSGFSQKAGEKNIGNKLYSHSQNKFGEIRELTVKWDFRTLLGEPVLNGSYKWVAGNNTPDDFLDYRDAIVLDLDIEFQRQIHFSGRYLYIKLAPLVPKSGEGYGFNVSGSPNWTDLFCDYNGNSLKLSERDAKDIWKWGFKITSAHLIREGGLDKVEPDKSSLSNNDFWNTPENTTTQNDLKQKDELDRQKQFTQQAKDKYNALKKPFTLNVTNRDTVSEASLQVLKAINPYFQNGILALSSVSNGKIISKANTANANLQLAEGWNTLRIAIKGDNFNLKDSVRVYYKKSSKRILFFDDFEDGILSEKWSIEDEFDTNIKGVYEKDGSLNLSVNDYRGAVALTNKFKIDLNKKIFVELKYQFQTELRNNKSLGGSFESNRYHLSLNIAQTTIYFQSDQLRDADKFCIGTNDNALYFEAKENTWIKIILIFNPNDNSLALQANDRFIGQIKLGKYISDSNILFLKFSTYGKFNFQKTIIDYISIYQQ